VLLFFPPCPYLRLQGPEDSSMGRKHRGGVKKKAASVSNCPDCADPRCWCVTHLHENGVLDDDGIDLSEGAPGFHAHYMVPESSERAPEHSTPQRAPEQPFPWLAPEQPAREQAEAVGPMMENFDTFLNYYEPTDEQVLLGSLLLLGIGDPDTTMERLLMSMLGSLEAHAEAAEAGLDF
jgi:hypothetical protein